MVSGPSGGQRAGDTQAGTGAGTGTGWPALGWEEHDWASKIPDDLVSTRMRARHRGPYRAAVVPVIADRAPPLPVHVASLADDASAEIARFDAELGAEVAPFASVLLRSESASSSRIENLTSGAKAIALAELGSTEKRNAAEIVGNVAAMRAALDLADRLDESAVLAMHAALMAGHAPSIGGRWREEQVWIGGDSYGPHGASFIPPHHRHVPALMADLLCFANRADVPVLSQAAVAHAQFETIHPFPDGNGRTGRALVHAMLRRHGLTRNVTVPVSAGLLTDTAAYFDALDAYRDGDVAPIVERFATASVTAITNGRQLASELRAIRAGWENRLKIRRDARAWQLADLLLRQPVVDAQAVAAELGVTRQNAQRVIAPLAEAGIITEFTGFTRNRMWQASEVLSALDSFAARAGRRGAP
ncbi:Fic family protein [Parafrankia irregularis]|uniref:Fic family protein n=1 Tax=Parafrankia irregularis TaxID=795642 RepID=A0A0S4QQ06_9ACTN|nr:MULTISPECIES: Fic family protein [Parafrankia]MBE3205973.1 Fic family protein [Parafrankia sp. CH37]CUU57150.1 Fic family protein [Parafrankia irregularis]